MFSARFYRERERLALRLDEVIRSCLSADQLPAVNDAAEDVYGDFAIGKHPEQREMRFYLGDVAAFTPRLVNAMRRLVADEFPKWQVVPQFDSHVFTVTANAVVFSDRVTRSPINEHTPAYAEWLAAARDYDVTRYGPMREQLGYLRPRISAALKAAGDGGFATVGAFDFYVPYFWNGNPVVWLVVGPSLAKDRVELQPAESLRSSAVTASGFVFPQHMFHFESVSDEPPAGHLMTFEFARGDQDVLLLKVKDGRQVGPVTVPRVMTRSELGTEAA